MLRACADDVACRRRSRLRASRLDTFEMMTGEGPHYAFLDIGSRYGQAGRALPTLAHARRLRHYAGRMRMMTLTCRRIYAGRRRPLAGHSKKDAMSFD